MKQRSDTDVHSTCLNHESKWGALRVAIQCIQADRVCGAWLQTLENNKKNTVKPDQNTKITLPKLLCICKPF